MWLVVIALNYEYVGRLEVAHWRHRQSPLAQQQVALGNIVEAVQYLLAKSDASSSFPDWREEVANKRVHYDGSVVSRAYPLHIFDLLPGLPAPGLAASVSCR